MQTVGKCQQNGVDLIDVFLQFVDKLHITMFIPSAVEQKSEIVQFQQIRMRRIVHGARQGAEFDNRRHFQLIRIQIEFSVDESNRNDE